MYIKLCDTNSLTPNEPRSFKIKDKEIMVIYHKEKYYCLDARCAHAGAPLAEGTLNEQVLTCPWHYSQFDITTGDVLRGPAQKPLKTYPNEVKDNYLFINIENY
jgi:nitrite reductase/ring-hydroxylating ferredoxin subunit